MSFDKEVIAALNAKLDGAHVKTRRQAGRELSYIEGWHAISEANRIFGFDAWDRETIEMRMVSERQTKIGPNKDRDGYAVAYIAKVRVTVIKDDVCVSRDGYGYGSGIDADPGSAHEGAIKEAETDAMKRALMTFGNPFGLALYDKTQENVERVVEDRRAPSQEAVAWDALWVRESYKLKVKNVADFSEKVAAAILHAPHDVAIEKLSKDNAANWDACRADANLWKRITDAISARKQREIA